MKLTSLLDVNIHPQKLELKISNGDSIYKVTYQMIREALQANELIPQLSLADRNKVQVKGKEDFKRLPEPFESKRMSRLDPTQQLKALEELANKKR